MKINYICIIAISIVSLLSIGCSPSPRLHTYEDGLFSFKLPANWQLESEGDSGLIFSDKNLGAKLETSSGMHKTLATGAHDRSLEALRFGKDQSIRVQPLGEKKAFSSYIQSRDEDGEKQFIQSWEVASPITPKLVLVVKFCLTIPAIGNDSAKFKHDITVLDECFHNVVFSEIEKNKNAQPIK